MYVQMKKGWGQWVIFLVWTKKETEGKMANTTRKSAVNAVVV